MRTAVHGPLLLLSVGLGWAQPAAAQTIRIDLPAGSVASQVNRLATTARISVAVADRALWARQAPALRGTMTPEEALRSIARHAGARIDRLAPGAFRLSALPAAAPPRLATPKRTPRPMPAPRSEAGADIVVTASKRDVTRNRFAGNVVRIDGGDLELGGAGGTDRLTSRMASVASTYLGAGRNKIFIRGIADSSFTGATQATVGQYYGDLRLSYNAPDPDLRLADLAAVEVLEGPQGTLYGAGSLGGLIRLVPNPVDLVRTSGSAAVGASATAHGRPGLDAQGVANVPLVADRLGIRLVGAVEEQGGYIDKPRLGRANVNRTRIEGGRATAHLAIDGDWSAELVGIGQRIVGADSQYTDRGRGLIRDAAVQEGFRAAFAQGQFVVNGRFGDVRFRSSTGLTAHDLRERYDATGPGEAPSLFQQTSKTRMAANETRLWQSGADGTGWLAGLSLTDNRTTLTRAFAHSAMFLPMVGIENAVRETTLYGEGSLRLLPHVLVNGGLRLTHSRIAGGFTDDSARGSTAAGMALTGARRQVVALPAISTLFELSPHSSLFVRYQQSFRPGGLAIDEDFARRFRSDRLGTIEAGYRTGRPNVDPLDLSLTLAYTNWRNIQADFIDGSGFPSTANIGDGRLWTIESNGGVRVADGLRIDTAVTFNASHVDEARELFAFVANSDTGPVTEAQVSARLRQIPNIAPITLRQGVTYRHVLAAGHELKVDAWARYVGPSRLGVGPILGQKQGDYIDTAVTARLGLGAIGITAGISNLFDARGNRFALGTPFTTGRDQVTPLRPRTVRIGFDATF